VCLETLYQVPMFSHYQRLPPPRGRRSQISNPWPALSKVHEAALVFVPCTNPSHDTCSYAYILDMPGPTHTISSCPSQKCNLPHMVSSGYVAVYKKWAIQNNNCGCPNTGTRDLDDPLGNRISTSMMTTVSPFFLVGSRFLWCTFVIQPRGRIWMESVSEHNSDNIIA
jgi:hypothetical protein